MGADHSQAILSDLRKSFSKDYLTEWTLTALAVLPALGSLLLSWLLSDGGTWFQRAGSLMVLFAVWLEFLETRKVAKTRHQDIEASLLVNLPLTSDTPVELMFQRIAIFMAILGTIIWGYGDLLFFWQA
ncbi:hypothetical protein [Fodinicurvata sediminis]|uniref:hypothetical protein n=1 Tax=Fodinicurvata sediminis TaxID=1121832 RepID=UPI0003B48BBA|nr:hypothetical protein [Fodinicurvata sediminis]